jgi:hypothetical protein
MYQFLLGRRFSAAIKGLFASLLTIPILDRQNVVRMRFHDRRAC